MRISDWSSDVCSSDLAAPGHGDGAPDLDREHRADGVRDLPDEEPELHLRAAEAVAARHGAPAPERGDHDPQRQRDRKSVVEGKSVSVRVDSGGRRLIKKNKETHKDRKRKTKKK